MPSILPVDQRVVLGSIVLYLEHPDAWYSPLEIKLDQRSWWRGFSCHYPLIYSTLHITCHIAAICTTSGWRGNVRRSWVRLLDVVSVVGDVGEFYNNQVNSLVGFTGRVGGDAGKGAGVFHSANEDIQSPVVVDHGPGRVRHQLALRRDPVNGWLWVTSCLTPLKIKNQWSGIYQ